MPLTRDLQSEDHLIKVFNNILTISDSVGETSSRCELRASTPLPDWISCQEFENADELRLYISSILGAAIEANDWNRAISRKETQTVGSLCRFAIKHTPPNDDHVFLEAALNGNVEAALHSLKTALSRRGFDFRGMNYDTKLSAFTNSEQWIIIKTMVYSFPECLPPISFVVISPRITRILDVLSRLSLIGVLAGYFLLLVSMKLGASMILVLLVLFIAMKYVRAIRGRIQITSCQTIGDLLESVINCGGRVAGAESTGNSDRVRMIMD